MSSRSRFGPRRRRFPRPIDLRHRPDADFQDFPAKQRRHIRSNPTIRKHEGTRRHFAERKYPDKKEGRRYMNPDFYTAPKGVGKRYIAHQQKADEYLLFSGAHKKPVQLKEHQIRSNSYYLEQRMGTKVKNYSRLVKRNGIPDRRPGDKPYAAVEYSKEFHQRRGLVPQIEFARTLPSIKRNDGQSRKAEKKGAVRDRRKMRRYTEVIAEQRHKAEQKEVCDLPSIPCDGDDSDIN